MLCTVFTFVPLLTSQLASPWRKLWKPNRCPGLILIPAALAAGRRGPARISLWSVWGFRCDDQSQGKRPSLVENARPTTQFARLSSPVSGLTTYQWYTQTVPLFLRSCLGIHPRCAISDRLLCDAGDCLNTIIRQCNSDRNIFRLGGARAFRPLRIKQKFSIFLPPGSDRCAYFSQPKPRSPSRTTSQRITKNLENAARLYSEKSALYLHQRMAPAPIQH